MKRFTLSCAVILLFSFCSPVLVLAADEAGKKNGAAEMPPAEGQAFVRYITETNSYKQWELWPGKDEMYKGTEPHGALLTTYVNKTALEAIKQQAGKMPEGAIIVKENYTPDRKLAAVTAMYRKSGFNPEAGDWFWIKYGPDGKIEASGKAEGCINCHGKAKGNDWLFTGNIGKSGG
ncbi:MAG: cytochrome P460 family protein [Desulfobulbaceae bacterium]|nr:cytochrome P460 family protein [Desulfobulbaceae bacterium]